MKEQFHQTIPIWENISPVEWNSWQWQMRNAITEVDNLNAILASFTDHRAEESSLIQSISRDVFSFKITPHMVLSLKDALINLVPTAWEAFAASFLPTESESSRIDFEKDAIDCIGEELSPFNPVPAITNFYGSRVLFRVTNMCPAYCRYCFRRRMVGDGLGAWSEKSIHEGIAYIESNKEIREVILSGGDPLILSDQKLSFVLESLKQIQHVRRLRIDSKALTMLPQRITTNFVNILLNHQPIYFIGHFTHPYELTEETKVACAKLADAGIPLGSHTPLLKGISDDEQILGSLMESLVDWRIQPYYLIHFIPTKWTEHFRVPLKRGIELIRYLFRNCGGLATPTLIVYLPEGGGKVPVGPNCILEKSSEGYLFKSLDGRTILYPEPCEIPDKRPSQFVEF